MAGGELAPPLMRAKVRTALALGHAEDCYQLLGHPWGPSLALEQLNMLTTQLSQLRSVLSFEMPAETAARRRVLAAFSLCAGEQPFRNLAMTYPEELLRALAVAEEGPVQQQLTRAARKQLPGVSSHRLSNFGC